MGSYFGINPVMADVRLSRANDTVCAQFDADKCGTAIMMVGEYDFSGIA